MEAEVWMMGACTASQLICHLRLSLPRERTTLTVTGPQMAWLAPYVPALFLPGQTIDITVSNAQAQRLADHISATLRARA